MKYFLFSFLIIFFFSACKKSGSEETFYYSGHLYDHCGGLPVKGKELYIYQHVSAGGNGGTLGSGTTDSTGYFKISFNNAAKSPDEIEIRYANSNYAVFSTPGYNLENLSDLKVYEVSTCNISVALNVTRNYTSSDTLYISDYRTPSVPLKLAGPFTNGVLYTASNYNLLVPSYNGASLYINYSINNTAQIEKRFRPVVCGDNLVTIDIN